jgi:hypothetical protein
MFVALKFDDFIQETSAGFAASFFQAKTVVGTKAFLFLFGGVVQTLSLSIVAKIVFGLHDGELKRTAIFIDNTNGFRAGGGSIKHTNVLDSSVRTVASAKGDLHF